MMMPRELWEHVPTGKKIVVEINEEGRVVGWYGPPDSDVESALEDADIQLIPDCDDINQARDKYRPIRKQRE
jgi:hypothetical protein